MHIAQAVYCQRMKAETVVRVQNYLKFQQHQIYKESIRVYIFEIFELNQSRDPETAYEIHCPLSR